MSNPYESPQSTAKDAVILPAGPPMIDRGHIGKIRVVAILMMVQAGLELLAGIAIGGLAAVMPYALESQPATRDPEIGPEMTIFVVALYGGIALLVLCVGGLRFYAGWRNYQLRNRVLGIVALSVGAITAFTCYCAPTSIALLIFGLIVFANGPVAAAFERVERGESPDSVLSS